MRQGKKVNHLGRTATHRKALMANMASSLILHKRINTTLAKAKALRTYVEPLLTKAKNDTIHSRRTVFAYLKDKTAVSELFRDISNKIADRPGGYTRIIKLGNRIGDNAELALIELVDYNENLLKETKSGKAGQKKTRRRGAAKAPKAAEAAPASTETVEEISAPVAETVSETPENEAVVTIDEPIEQETASAEAVIETPEAETPAVESAPEISAESAPESEQTESPEGEAEKKPE